MLHTDGGQVPGIWKTNIESGDGTFDTVIPSWKEWDKKQHARSRFVFEKSGMIIGRVALSPCFTRQANRGAVEISIVVHNDFTGREICPRFPEQVIITSEENGIWRDTVIMGRRSRTVDLTSD